MKFRLAILFAVAIGVPSSSFGQADSRVIVIPSVVLALQPEDKTYTSPYLENYLGGFAWGGSVAVLGERKSFIFGGELNTARHSEQLAGRITSSKVSFQETFVSGLLGYSSDRRNFHVVGGPGMTLGTPEYQGRVRDPNATQHWFALAGGVNWLVPSKHQVQFAIGVRYYYVFAGGGEFSRIGLGTSALRGSIGLSLGSAK